MKSSIKLVVTLALALGGALQGRDMSSMYDTATLQQWAPRYRDSTNRILNNFVFKYLKAAELRALANVSIDFPLAAASPMRGQPLAFYAPANNSRTVVFPIFSVKFLDDLSTAYAWLQIKGYRIDTISEYTAMLAHKELGGTYPTPLTALHIPVDALRDKRVDELAVNHFVTARMFILLHELGHIYHGHRQSAIPNEIAADQFAVEVMRRSPVPPLGMLVYFMADASMAEYPATASSHPLSGSRLRALGSAMQDAQISIVLGDLAKLVDDPEVRASHIITAKATNPQTLMPRRGNLPRIPGSSTGDGRLLFSGRCSGQFTQQVDPGNAMSLEMVLKRTGNSVSGQYAFGLGSGIIRGTVTGTTLNLEWQWANNYGQGTLWSTDGGKSLTGEWGYRQANRGGGTWSCRTSN